MCGGGDLCCESMSMSRKREEMERARSDTDGANEIERTAQEWRPGEIEIARDVQ